MHDLLFIDHSNFVNKLLLFFFSFYFFLLQVIFETSRLATIVNGVLRKTTQDMELNGE